MAPKSDGYGKPHQRLAERALQLAGAHWAGDGTFEVTRVEMLGDGTSRTAWYADIDIAPDPRELSSMYVALVPREVDITDRAARESRVLDALGALDLPIRVPRRGVMVDVAGKPVLVREYIRGLPLDSALPRGDERRVSTTARVAAAIHRLDAPLASRFATRRDHAEGRILASFAGLDGAVVADARAWCDAHLPPAAPSSFLHGDLLGQNLLLGRDEPDGVIDWEHALWGDPAYDLAIATRGVKHPFQVTQGFRQLLHAYAEAGGQPISASEVRLHELCLLAGWHADSLRGGGEAPEATLERLAKGLERAERSR